LVKEVADTNSGVNLFRRAIQRFKASVFVSLEAHRIAKVNLFRGRVFDTGGSQPKNA
jgi:hypothetical protein